MKLAHTTMLGLWAAVAFGAAFALDLPDPTRPPYATTPGGTVGTTVPMPPPRTAGSVAAGQAAGADTPDATRGTQEAGRGSTNTSSTGRLSAVLLADAPGRNAAVIDGQVRYVGDRVTEGTVAGISAGGVTIKGSGRTVQLSLYDREPEPLPLTKEKVAVVRTPTDTEPRPIDSSPSGASAPGKEQP